MNNADKPAMPQEWEAYVEGNAPSGLTKREYFAGLAMQGVLANPSMDSVLGSPAQAALYWADELLAELEKSK